MFERVTSARLPTRNRTCLPPVDVRSIYILRRSGRLHLCVSGLDTIRLTLLCKSSLLGWKMGVSNRIFGGSSGYSVGKVNRARKNPPKHLSAFQPIMRAQLYVPP